MENTPDKVIRVEGTGPLYDGVLDVLAKHGYRVVKEGVTPLFLLANVRRIVPPEEYNAATIGTLCFHPSLLPKHRGADAVYWTVKMGDTETGISWFWVTDVVDGGPVAIKRGMPMPPDIRPRDLYEQHLAPLGVSAFEELLLQIESGTIPREIQDESQATFEPLRPKVPKPQPQP